MKIVVTGAAGFIGSHVCEALAGVGHEVAGLDSFTDYYPVELKRRNEADVEKVGVKISRLDLCTDRLSEVLDGAEVVFHLAAQPGIAAHVDLSTYVRNNIDATHRLLEACVKLERFGMLINISTSSVYGYLATRSEDVPPEPASYYGVTKLAAEQLALSYSRQGRLPVCSLRLYSVYGPRERPEKLFSKLIGCVLHGRPFPLYEGSESHVRSYTYVSDAVDGILSVLSHIGPCDGEIFNIGSDTEVTTGEAIRLLEEMVGRQVEKEILPPRSGDQLQTRAVIDKARRFLAYSPRVSMREGLQACVEWFNRQPGRR